MGGCGGRPARDALELTETMDLGIVASIVLLLVWAAGTWFEIGGWVHLLLTAGVFLFIWRVVARGNPAATGKR